MKILNYTSEHRNDFSAKIQCEHCAHVQDLRGGYHDAHYHSHVVPAITCKACGKNRAGVVPAKSNDEGVKHVGATV